MKTDAEKPCLVLSARHLGFFRAERAIFSEITFSLFAGDRVALLGENGIGKSTLLRVLAGYWSPFGGEVEVSGIPLQGLTAHERVRRIGYLPQHVETSSLLTVIELLRAAASRVGCADIEPSIQSFGLQTLRYRPLYSLSGGEKRRVLIAAASLGSPHCLLFDEPTASLDPALRTEFWEGLDSGLKMDGRALLFSTHDIHEALSHATTILCMVGSPAKCREMPVADSDLESVRQLFFPASLRV